MSSSNSCFLTCIQVSQEADQVVWYSHLSEFSTVYCDPHSQRLCHSQWSRNRCFSGTLMLFSMIQRILAIKQSLLYPFSTRCPQKWSNFPRFQSWRAMEPRFELRPLWFPNEILLPSRVCYSLQRPKFCFSKIDLTLKVECKLKENSFLSTSSHKGLSFF